MENLFDETAISSITVDGYDVVEVIENNKSYDHEIFLQEDHEKILTAELHGDDSLERIAQNVYDYLSEVYGMKVPADIFRKKCLERGMTSEDVNHAILKYKDKFVK